MAVDRAIFEPSGQDVRPPGASIAQRLEPLLTTPASDLTPAYLRIDPTFKPMMHNPRLQRLLR